jgi:hypothetical protein
MFESLGSRDRFFALKGIALSHWEAVLYGAECSNLITHGVHLLADKNRCFLHSFLDSCGRVPLEAIWQKAWSDTFLFFYKKTVT